jgi:hypothetical protein
MEHGLEILVSTSIDVPQFVRPYYPASLKTSITQTRSWPPFNSSTAHCVRTRHVLFVSEMLTFQQLR